MRTVLAMLALLCTGLAHAQKAPDIRPLIEQLGSESWLERDLATIELGELGQGITLADLEPFIASPDLGPEQRARLMDACTQRFIAEPKGALGVQFGTIRIGAIEVQPIEANAAFPASTMLNPGDQIATVDGQIVEGSLELRAQILSRRPGDILPVTILRRDAQSGQDRLIELQLPLGSFDTLTGAARMDPALVQRALALRLARAGISFPSPRPVGAALDIEAWTRAAFPPDRAPDPRAPDRRSPSVIITGASLPVQTGYGSAAPPSRPWGGADQLARDARNIADRIRAEELQVLVARRLLLEQQRRQLLEAAQNPNADDPAALRARADEATDRLDALSARIEALRAQQAPADEQP